MVSIVWSVIAFSSGLLAFMLPAIVGQATPVKQRQRIAQWYYNLSQKAYRQTALVWRTLGGPELHPIAVDDEQQLAQVTLSSGLISDDKTLPFKDPDDRMSRLAGKPFTLVPETLPAAVDAELAEVGHWFREHDREHGRWHERPDGQGGTEIVVDPYFPVGDDLRLVNPLDAMFVAGSNGVEPSYIETAKQITKQRFAKYGTDLGAAETLGTLLGFGVGAGGVAGLQYLRQNTLDGGGGGGGGSTLPIPPGSIVPDPETLVVTVDVLGVVL